MGVKRIVDSGFWTDGKVDEFSPEDKYFLLYLLTNPFSKQLGIYEISIKQAAFQMGYSEDAFRALLDRFETKYNMILFSKETSEIAILNFLRHSVVKGGKPVADCIWRDISLVKDKSLIEAVFRHLQSRDGLNSTVKRIIHNYMIENDNKNDNDNDNDNDSYVPVTDNVSSDVSSFDTPSQPPKPPQGEEEASKKPKKHRYGEYKNVLLTDEEYKKLQEEYDSYHTQKAIKYLDEYIEMKGYKAKSHYLAIKKWVFNALEEEIRRNAKNGKMGASSSFETDDFFGAALNRSYGEPPPTAGDDSEIKRRADALKERLI